MSECEHKDVEESSYPQEYYGRWTIITETKCLNCGEILDEKESDF